MRPILIAIDPADANLTGFASNVTGATFTLTNTIVGDSLAHKVSVLNDTATDHSLKTIDLVGTDADDRVQIETIAGPAGSATVQSTKYFKTLTSITPSATIGADTFDIGWVDEFATCTKVMDWYRETAPMVSLNVTGTCSLDVQLANDNPFTITSDQESLGWVDDDTLAAVTADAHGSLSDWPMKSVRIISNSYTNGAEAIVEITQAN